MKRIAILVASVLIVMAACLYIIASRTLDGTKAWFISHAPGFTDSTVYAPGYSDEAFRSISEGMTTQELIQVLGPPIHVWPSPPPPENRVQYMNWSYTKSSMQESFTIGTKEGFNIRLRMVGVYDGKVSYRRSQLKVDTCYAF